MMVFRSLAIGLLSALMLLELVHLNAHLHSDEPAPPQWVPAPVVVPAAGPWSNPERCLYRQAAEPPMQDDTRIVEIQRATINHYLEHTPLAQQARMIPSRRHGRPNGVKIYYDGGTQPANLLSVLGLAHGDTLLSVNDKPVLDSGMGWLTVMGSPAQPSFLDLEIERRGVPMRILVLIHE